MTPKERYKQELENDIKIEKRLWLKEVVVCIVILILIVIREVYLNVWFNFNA